MPRTATYYSQANHSVIVNGLPMRDFMEGDSISWEDFNPDQVTVTEGLDGARLSFGSGKAGKINIKLKPTSISATILDGFIELQKSGNAVPMLVAIMSGTNEIVVLKNAGVTRDAQTSGGTTMTERSYNFIGTKMTIS